MKVRYLGPRSSVIVAPYGAHPAGEIKDYPEEFARDLVSTSLRQQFELAEPEITPPEPEPAPRKRQAKRSFFHEK